MAGQAKADCGANLMERSWALNGAGLALVARGAGLGRLPWSLTLELKKMGRRAKSNALDGPKEEAATCGGLKSRLTQRYRG
jgi:hypothetical protein